MKYRLLGLMPVGKNLKDDDGKTALDIAKAMNYTNVVKILEAK